MPISGFKAQDISDHCSRPHGRPQECFMEEGRFYIVGTKTEQNSLKFEYSNILKNSEFYWLALKKMIFSHSLLKS